MQDEKQEARAGGEHAEFFREQPTGGRHGGGSLMVEIRKPAAVKASVIACSGRSQKLIRAVWPSMVHSSVQLQVVK